MSNIDAGRDVISIGSALANTIVFNTGDHTHPGAASGSRTIRQDVFKPSFQAPANPREVVLDFGDPLNCVEPQTQEARVLHELLREDCNQCATRVVTVHGKGGVGKSCILRALARHEKLRERFPDGIYFLSLGMDAGMSTLIQGLAKITRLSGGNVLGNELRGEDSLEKALQIVGGWMNGKTCLLLADDFWGENRLGVDVVTELAEMLSDQSMVVVTTRFSGVATRGTEIEIKPLGKTSEEAKEILLRYSKFDWQEVNQEKAAPAFDKLLRMCAGLPIFLAIVGKAVAKIALRLKHISERTAVWEECVCMVEDSELLETNVQGYKGLGRTLHMSLKLLSEDCGELFKGLSQYSLSEMHRAFCVFKKQAAIPISVCRRLWKVGSDGAALRIGMGFADVGLADVEIERRGDRLVKVVRLHDLVHIFALKCAKGEGEVMRWHERLLEGYISKGASREFIRRWWEVEERSGEKYLFENICRHLAGCGNIEELAGLLLSGEWTMFRHKHGGLSAWKQDFAEYAGLKTVVGLSEREKEIESGMRTVRDAVIESWAVVHTNLHELGFQMFGRLIDCESSVVGKYLESLEKAQCGVWLRPMQRLWAQPGESGMTAEFELGDNISDIAVQKDLFIAAAAVGTEVAIIDLKEMAVRRRRIHTEVWKVGISADGKRVYSLSHDFTLRQWDVQSRKEDTDKCVEDESSGEETPAARSITPEASSGEGNSESSSREETSEASSGEETGEESGGEGSGGEESSEESDAEGDKKSPEYDELTCAAFCPSKSLIITGSVNGNVQAWDLTSLQRIGHVMHAGEYVECIEVSLNGRTIAAGVAGMALLLWDVQTFTPLEGELKGYFTEISSIAFSSDGRYVASADGSNGGAGAIQVWDVENRTRVRDPFLNSSLESRATSIAFSADGHQIISGHWRGFIIVWDVASGAAIRSWKAHVFWVACVAVAGDGESRCAVSCGRDHIARVWDLQTAANVSDERPQHDGVVECVAASPDGRFFVSASRDKTLRIWNAVDGTALGAALRGHEGPVTCVAVSPDSQQLVSGSWDCTLRVWDVGTGAQVGDALGGHWSMLKCIAYSGDGRFVVSGSNDGTARVWRVIENPKVDKGIYEGANTLVRTSEPGLHEVLLSQESLQLGMVLNHELPDEDWHQSSKVTSVTMSPDGQRVLSGYRNGEIWVWDTTSGICIYRTKCHNGGEIVEIEISEKDEVVTMNESYEEFRWQLDDGGSLARVLENEDETGAAQAEPQEDSVSDRLNSITCHDRAVRLSGSGIKIATLPDKVGSRAWKYDAEQRLLCAGFRDGRVLFFRVVS